MLLPLLAAIALAFVPRNFAVIMRAVAVGVTFVTMLLAVLMFWQFRRDGGRQRLQVRQHHSLARRGIARHRLQAGRGRLERRAGVDGRDRGVRGGVLLVRDQDRARRSFTSCCS